MTSAMMIRAAEQADHDAWAKLFTDYMAFYDCTPSEAVLQTTWRWILDPEGPMECLLAVKDAQVVGFAQYRAVPETLTGAWFGQLDDLFVAPAARRQGVAEALMAELDEIARERGWFKLAWITAKDNAEARKLYDRIGKASNWVVYEQPIGG
ncbi:MAG: N-acetyltransferase family protein [Thalassospira sp.]|uniref:GNAT family N-acetyltransferase n=1 Tax=Thalassospira sp. TaxID=1912094 RepID=UPI003A83A4C2